MKKLLSFILAVMLVLCTSASVVLADDRVITVKVNGEKLETDVPAQPMPVYDDAGNYVGDRVMVPIRAISEKLNCDVAWDGETRGITLYRKNNIYIMWADRVAAFHIAGKCLEKGYILDVPPTIVDGRTLLPVRAVSEIMGANVEWIAATNTVDIKYDLGEVEKNEGIAASIVAQKLLEREYAVYESLLKGTIETVTGKIVLESGEEIGFELYPQIAPKTCEKFVECAKTGFYDNTLFHRVINDFMIQGGGVNVTGKSKHSENVYGEFLRNIHFNIIPHTRGVISLARAQDYNSGSSQFFICQQDSRHLDGNYAAFGKVTYGMNVVDKIASVPTDANDAPVAPVIVKQVIINE